MQKESSSPRLISCVDMREREHLSGGDLWTTAGPDVDPSALAGRGGGQDGGLFFKGRGRDGQSQEGKTRRPHIKRS